MIAKGPPTGGLWTPANLPSGILDGWWDCDDSSTVFLYGIGNIQQINDKSGFGNNITGNIANAPSLIDVGGLNYIDFQPATAGTPLALTNGAWGTVNAFFIYQTNKAQTILWDNPTSVLSLIAESGSASTVISVSVGTPSYYLNSQPAGWVTRNDVFLDVNLQYNVIEWRNFDTSNFAASIRYGEYPFGGFRFKGHIGEHLMVDPSITSADTERIEGYMAWKWGLEAKLPIGHPYKSAPPTI